MFFAKFNIRDLYDLQQFDDDRIRCSWL